MDFLLFDPVFVTGTGLGFLAGALVTGGLIHLGHSACERRLRLEKDLISARIRAAEGARGWDSAANDDGRARSARREMRAGPR